jgi:RimJ/RimL family protein N-acetyltransferase
LLGNHFVLLRKEFISNRGFTREISSNARRILVTLGGSNRREPIFTILSALDEAKLVESELESILILGDSNQHHQEIRSYSEGLALPVRIKNNVENMAEVMAWADLAVSGAGTTCWELAYMGLPSIAIILAKNQSMLGQGVHSAGLALNLGWYHNLTVSKIIKTLIPLLSNVSKRKAMSQRGQTIIDGDGVDRVVMYLTNQPFRLRLVREEDCKLVWQWANEPGARAASFSEDFIPWENHLEWFNSKLNDPNCVLYIAVDRDEKPIGQIRYDTDDTEAVTSINLDEEYRGKGYGSLLINMSAKKLFSSYEIDTIHAHIKSENIASIWAFLTAGFEEVEMKYLESKKVRHFVLERKALENG